MPTATVPATVPATAPATAPAHEPRAPRKPQILALLKGLETGDRAALAVIHPARYVQHNLGAADGLAGVEAFLRAMPPGSVRVQPVRVFEDGDYIFTHSRYELGGPKVGFDVYRFEGDRVVEHWDNLQAAAGPNASGRGMTDGPVGPGDPARTEATRRVVAGFARDVLVGRRLELLSTYYDGERLLQHNPQFGDGVAGMRVAFAGPARPDSPFRLDVTHKVLAEGDFALVITEGALGGEPAAFYDLYRVEHGKIAEHWDVIERMPPRAAWQNGNGKFGFAED